MSADQNKAAVLEFYGAASSGDAEKAIAMLVAVMDPEITVHESPLVPWGGDYRGIEQFGAVLAQISTYVDVAGWEVVDVVADGDVVVSRCFVPYHATPDATPVRVMLCEWFRFREGCIVEIWPLFFDVPSAP